MTAEGGGMTADSPRDYSPEAEGVRDCCANLAMTLRAVADGPAYPEDDELRAWASRLERACAKLDEDRQLAAQYREDYDNCCRGQADLRVRVAAAEAASQRLTNLEVAGSRLANAVGVYLRDGETSKYALKLVYGEYRMAEKLAAAPTEQDTPR